MTRRSGRWVLHLDMDAFFASVEQLTRPTLADRPVLVGGLGPRGVVAGASYQARKYGARSAMPMSQARRLVPVAVVLPPRIGLYRVLSEQVFDIVRQVGGVMEQISVDEAFLEPPELAGAPPDEVERVAETIRAKIRAETGLTGSVGAGSGKQLAKIASTMAKPDGVRVVPHGTERDHLAPMPVRKLWGVGPVAEATLHRAGVETIGALAALSLGEITALLGTAIGTELHGLAQGVDHRPVAERGEAKQVSAETTFDIDLSDLGSVRRAVADMAEHAHRRLLSSGRAARTVTVKIRGGDFTTRSRSETALTASTDLGAFTATAQRLTENALPESGVRLIGVSLSGLVDFIQPTLFEPETPADAGATPGTASALVAPGVAATGVMATGVAATETPQTDGDSGPAGPAGAGRDVVEATAPELPERSWRAGDDVLHAERGHGWVQGSGHGRVTVRFETRTTGPGQARTFFADDPDLCRADPTGSLA
ncbi:MAG TPA: DNA polymerase IV [Pseudonocardia sp.]|jgi:DNA polymerase-4|nr:DNA polymerase IV [Pseudonocardia sp.]